ncbi:MAG: TolC family protein [Gemmatimonadales bacterium]
MSAAFAALLLTGTAAAQQQASVTSVTLDEAIQRARVYAPSVVSAQGAIRTAELSVRSGFMAFLPSLSVTPRADLQLTNGQSRIDPVTGSVISTGSATSEPSLSFGASASYTIFDGFARNYTLSQRRAAESAAEASLVTSQYSSDFTVTGAFFTALGGRQLVVAADTNLAAAQSQLQLASAKLHAGSGQLSDSLTALGNYLQARLQLLTAQSNLVVYEANLGRLVGVAGRVAAIDDSAYYRPPTPLDTAAIREEAMATAPSIRALQDNVVAAEKAYRASKAAYWPTLSASAATSWTATKPGYSFIPRRNLQLTFSINPWTNLTRETQIENASIQIDNAEASLADQRNLLAAQLNQAFAGIATAQETITVTDQQVIAGEENLRVVTERYRIGVATITDVLTAQQQMVSAQTNQVNARYSYYNAKASLEQILGRKL